MIFNSMSVVTALMMLAHSVLGCCWHHVHHDAHAQESSVSTASDDIRHGVHSHDACSHHHAKVKAAHDHVGPNFGGCCHHESPEDEGHGHGPCSGSRCSFVKTSPVSIDGFWVGWFATTPQEDVPLSISLASRELNAANLLSPLGAQAARAVTQCWLL